MDIKAQDINDAADNIETTEEMRAVVLDAVEKLAFQIINLVDQVAASPYVGADAGPTYLDVLDDVTSQVTLTLAKRFDPAGAAAAGLDL